MRARIGLSAKSSLKHSFSRASLDDAILPTRGALLRLTTEVANEELMNCE